MSEAVREMPKYQSHKQVWGLKIKSIEGLTITPAEEGYGPFGVSAEYMEKHKPEVGGYYVTYEGGYKSFSPADAFESGNKPVGARIENLDQLMTFYDAKDLNQLIAEQADHVRQLQERLKPFLKEPHSIGRLREG